MARLGTGRHKIILLSEEIGRKGYGHSVDALHYAENQSDYPGEAPRSRSSRYIMVDSAIAPGA